MPIEDPTPVDRCLGCHHSETQGTVNGKPVKIMQFKVEQFMASCVQAYKDLCGEPDMKLRAVETPFIASPDGGVMLRRRAWRVIQLAVSNPLLVPFS